MQNWWSVGFLIGDGVVMEVCVSGLLERGSGGWVVEVAKFAVW